MNRAITILSTQRPGDKTGVRVFCDSLERELAKSVLHVDRMTHHDCSVLCQKACVFLLKMSRLAGRAMQQVVARWTIYLMAMSALRRKRPTGVVLAQDPITGAAASRLGLPTLVVCHFSDPVEEILRATPMKRVSACFLRRLMQVFLETNHHYLVLTASVARVMKRYVPNAKIDIVPTICRLPDFLEPIPHEGFRVVMAGRLERLKGQERLIRILPMCGTGDVELHLVGDGPDRQYLENLASELGVASKVKFWGFVEQPEDVFRQCDLYIHASHMECMPLAPLEAIFSGVMAWCYEFPGYNDSGLFDGVPQIPQSITPEALARLVVQFCSMQQDEKKMLSGLQKSKAEQFRGCVAVERYIELCGNI